MEKWKKSENITENTTKKNPETIKRSHIPNMKSVSYFPLNCVTHGV